MLSALAPRRRHKYGAKPVLACARCGTWHQAGPFAWERDGAPGQCINCRHDTALRFASQLEARRFAVLQREEQQGAISALAVQPRFKLTVNGVTIATYVADFSYLRAGRRVVEDAKGVETPAFKLKRKLLAALHGITVEIVR